MKDCTGVENFVFARGTLISSQPDVTFPYGREKDSQYDFIKGTKKDGRLLIKNTKERGRCLKCVSRESIYTYI